MKLKNTFLLFTNLLLIIFMLVSLTSCNSSGSSKISKETDVIELSLAHFFPGTHPAETELVQGWSNEIQKATKGKVKIVSYPGGTLLSAPETYNGVVDGVADIGLSCFAYTRGRFPVLEAFELPGTIYKNSKSASKTAWEGIKELNPEEVKDTKLMMVIATGPGDLFTKVPVKKLDDIQGLEIRATGLSAKTIEQLGGTPVAMDQSEAYEALSKGIVKGNLSPVEVLKGWRHAEVTEYLTKTPFLYNTLFFVTMNLDKWNSIPKDIQETILKVNEKYYEEVAIGLWDRQNETALEWAVNEEGMEIINLSDEESALWQEKVKPIQDEYSQRIKENGIKQDVLKVVNNLSEKYNGQY